MPNIKLLSQEAKELFETFEELSPEDFQTAIQSIEQKGLQAVAPLCDVIDELQIRAEDHKNLAKRYSELASAEEARIERMKKSILWIMKSVGQKKLSNGALTVIVNEGKGSLEIVDETLIPDKYKKATITIPADQLDTVRILVGDHIEKEVVAVSKTAIKDEIKKYAEQNEGQTLEVAGTQIIKNPYITIKG